MQGCSDDGEDDEDERVQVDQEFQGGNGTDALVQVVAIREGDGVGGSEELEEGSGTMLSGTISHFTSLFFINTSKTSLEITRATITE